MTLVTWTLSIEMSLGRSFIALGFLTRASSGVVSFPSFLSVVGMGRSATLMFRISWTCVCLVWGRSSVLVLWGSRGGWQGASFRAMFRQGLRVVHRESSRIHPLSSVDGTRCPLQTQDEIHGHDIHAAACSHSFTLKTTPSSQPRCFEFPIANCADKDSESDLCVRTSAAWLVKSMHGESCLRPRSHEWLYSVWLEDEPEKNHSSKHLLHI